MCDTAAEGIRYQRKKKGNCMKIATWRGCNSMFTRSHDRGGELPRLCIDIAPSSNSTEKLMESRLGIAHNENSMS